MEPTADLIARLDHEDLEQARRMTAEQRLEAGGDLFDQACAWTMAGIRNDHPDWGDAKVMEELRRRLELGRRLERRP